MRLSNVSTEIQESIDTATGPQHIALMYSAFDIIDDTRVNLENPVSVQEIFNAEEDITPGNMCAASLDAHIQNRDGIMSDFDFARDFGLYMGVETAEETLQFPYALHGALSPIVYINGLIVWYYGTKCYIGLQDTPATYKSYNYNAEAVALYAVVNCVYIVNAEGVCIGRIVTSASGTTLDEKVTGAYTASITLSGYAKTRILNNAARGTNEKWSYYTGYVARESYYYKNIETREIVHTTTLYVPFEVFRGIRPRKVLGDDITLTTQDTTQYFDADASNYISQVFSAAQTRAQIANSIISNVATASGAQFSVIGTALLGNVTYTTNPFAGFKGYSYRDLMKLLAESAGLNIRVSRVQSGVYPNTGNLVFTTVLEFGLFDDAEFSSSVRFFAFGSDIYSYDCDEYSVTPIQKIKAQATENDIGVVVPDSPAGDNGLAIVDNPLIIGNDEATLKSYAVKAFDNLADHSGNYYPGTVNMNSMLRLQPGDAIRLIPASKTLLVFALTTTWAGYAECTIESTGKKNREVLTGSVKQKLRNGKKFHDFIVDLAALTSRIGDAEGNISTINQEVGVIQTEVLNAGNQNMLRGTSFPGGTLGVDGNDGIDWDHAMWGRAVATAASNYSIIDVSVPLNVKVKKGLHLSTSTEYDTAVYQNGVLVTAGKTYTLSCYAKASQATTLDLYLKEINTFQRATTNITTEWTQVHLTVTISSGVAQVKVGFECPNASGITIDIAGMQLEEGSSASPWKDCNEMVFSRITQTEGKIQTEISDALGNYYTQTETAEKISRDITNALGDYSTTNQTSDMISAYVSNNAYGLVSGISINSNGIDITGSKYVRINSGCSINIKSGGTFTLESGNFAIDASGNVAVKGNMTISSGKSLLIKTGGTFSLQSGNLSIDASGNVAVKGDMTISSGKSLSIKTGGTFSLQSGNFAIDSSGNVAVKGDMTITSGKSLSIKTGGTFSLQSGNFAIDSSGNVAFKGDVEILSGKSMKIKTGGTLTVDSGNLTINSSGEITAGNFQFATGGLKYINGNTYFGIGQASAGNTDLGIQFIGSGTMRIVPQGGNYGYLEIRGGSLGSTNGLSLVPQALIGTSSGIIKYADSYLGRPDAWDHWDYAYIDTLYYSDVYEQSSRELKTDIQPIDIPGGIIDALQPVSFRYKSDTSGKLKFGLIHEDTFPLLPEICKGNADSEPRDKAIDYTQLIAILLSEVQKLRARVEALEA